MKNTFILLAFLLGFFTLACSSEKKDTPIIHSDSLAHQPVLADTSQEIIEPLRFFVYEDSLDWKKYEQEVTSSFREQTTEQLKVHFDSLAYAYDDKKFKDSFHFMDLNADKKQDAIYNGFSGSEPNMVKIFLNNGKELIPVFEGYQDLSILVFDKNKKLTSFTLLDFGCCGEYDEYETKYYVDIDFNITFAYQRARVVRTQAPQHIWQKPIKFTTLNDDYALRSEPKKYDVKVGWFDIFKQGNVVAQYPKNARGLAWAEYKEKSGRVWWFVEMYPAANIKENLIFPRDSSHIPRSLGWMSSRFVQKRP